MHDTKIAAPKLEARPNVCELFESYRLLVKLMQNLLSDVIK
jgi:hypothetical protein